LTLHIRQQGAGEGRIPTQPGGFFLAGEGLNIGRDGGQRVTEDLPAPHRGIHRGVIRRVFVDVSGDAFADLAHQAARFAQTDLAR
jgi:arylsulfatase